MPGAASRQELCPSPQNRLFLKAFAGHRTARQASNDGSKTRVREPSDSHEETYISRQIVRSGRSAREFFGCGRKRAGISVAQPCAAMEASVPRTQVRLMAVMVILMWWSYIEWIRPVMLPSRHEQRLVFPPGALDPHSAYRHLFFPRVRSSPLTACRQRHPRGRPGRSPSQFGARTRATAASAARRRLTIGDGPSDAA